MGMSASKASDRKANNRNVSPDSSQESSVKRRRTSQVSEQLTDKIGVIQQQQQQGKSDLFTAVKQTSSLRKQTSARDLSDAENDEIAQDNFEAQDASNVGRFTVMRHKLLGNGGFGVVYQGFDNVRGEHVAVKEALMGQMRPDVTKGLEQEFALLTSLDHPHIVHVYSFSVENGVAQIVMEWMSSGSVQSILDQTGFRMHELAVRRYAQEALMGLQYLHGRGILHRDIKPGNILISGSGVVKLSDFGTSKVQETTSTTQHVVGTCAYMAPEAIQGRYSVGSDMWAWACTVVEMAQGSPPWSHLPKEKRGNIQLMFHIGTAREGEHHPPVPEHLTAELRAVLLRCFALKPEDRPTAESLLQDPYFAKRSDPEGVETLEDFERQRTSHTSTSEYYTSTEVLSNNTTNTVETVTKESSAPATKETTWKEKMKAKKTKK